MSVSKISLSNIYLQQKQNIKKKSNPQFSAQQNSPIIENKQKNKKLAIAGLAILAIGGLIYWKRDSLGLNKIKKNFTQKNLQKLEIKISELKTKYKPDAMRVLQENTHNNIVNIGAIEPAAAIRSASPTEKNSFHQAASWIEEAYKNAYSRAELKDGNNILNYIYRRIGTENNTLAQMYAQMPKEEAQIRARQFATEALKKDKHTGLTIEQFVSDVINKLVPKAKQDLKIK